MKLVNLILCSFLIASALRADAESAREEQSLRFDNRGLTLEEVTRAALANNAAIKAARANWERMKARIPQARAWEDPMVGVDGERFGTTRFSTYTDAEWMLSQKIPIAGKNLSRGRVADAEARATLQELRRQEFDVVAKVRMAYFRLLNARAQLEVNRRNEGLLSQFLEISRAKYEVGTQTQASVLIAETDLVRLGEDRKDIERDLSDAQSQLNVVMTRPARTPLGQPADVAVRRSSFAANQIEALALVNRPELERAANRIAAERHRLEVARRDWIPEPQLRVEARSYKGNSQTFQEYDTGIFFNVPFVNWRKYRAQQQEARSGIEMTRRELENARAETLGLVRDALKKVETFHHHVTLFRDQLLPIARQTVEANQASYEADKVGFLDLITAQRSLRDIEATYYRHIADYRTALAELESIVGADLQIFPPASLTNSSRNAQ